MGKSDMKIDEVRPGDLVVIRDRSKNFLEGEAKHEQGSWFIHVFNTKIEFGRDRQNGLGPRMIAGVHLAGHTAQLINERPSC